VPAARAAGGVIIARVPLASGLLTGKYTRETTFAANDHRNFNRDGSAFDVGETFSGVDFETGLTAANEFAALVPEGLTPAQAALAWVAQIDGVSSVIPGARSVKQAQGNGSAGALPQLPDEFMVGVQDIYDRLLREAIHPRW
jgi:aryl-alcohol dehydrogenase-like predicted oxidoreductase